MSQKFMFAKIYGLKVAKNFSYANEIINIKLSAKVYLHETFVSYLKSKIVSLKKHHDMEFI